MIKESDNILSAVGYSHIILERVYPFLDMEETPLFFLINKAAFKIALDKITEFKLRFNLKVKILSSKISDLQDKYITVNGFHKGYAKGLVPSCLYGIFKFPECTLTNYWDTPIEREGRDYKNSDFKIKVTLGKEIKYCNHEDNDGITYYFTSVFKPSSKDINYRCIKPIKKIELIEVNEKFGEKKVLEVALKLVNERFSTNTEADFKRLASESHISHYIYILPKAD